MDDSDFIYKRQNLIIFMIWESGHFDVEYNIKKQNHFSRIHGMGRMSDNETKLLDIQKNKTILKVSVWRLMKNNTASQKPVKLMIPNISC